MVQDQGRVIDGFLTAQGGVDSGFPPSLIAPNQLAWAVNTTVRGGFPTARPGWWKRALNFGGDDDLRDAFEDGRFQGAGTYISDSGQSYIAVSVSGRIFLIDIKAGFAVREITITGDPSSATRPHAWFQQAENFLIVQNGQENPFIWDGAGSRRANSGGVGTEYKEVPIGGPMAYGKGRLWVARGSEYFGGDLVGSVPSLGRGSVLRFSENDFLNEGGGFSVANGPITGLAFAANLDTSLGDGDLLVFTALSTYAFNAPIDRDVWKDLQYPIQRFALLNYGSLNHEGIAIVNGDLLFRAVDGVRSLIYARRDFTEWGNTPISRQVQRALQFDTPQWLTEVSATTFDNRMLMTVQPANVNGRGIVYAGMVALDYDLVSGMGQKWSPAWEGVWTGLRILRVMTIRVGTDDRCFILCLGEDDDIELFEVTKAGLFDFDGAEDVPTQWLYETRSVIFGDPMGLKRLESCDMWYDRVAGEVDVNVRYRVNESECWATWGSFEDCSTYKDCTEGDPCQEIRILKPAARARVSLPMPPDQTDPQTGGFTHTGYEFQLRFELTGRMRMKRLVMIGRQLPMSQFGDFSRFTCAEPATVDCQTGCLEIECAGYCSSPPDYGYTIT